MKRKSADEARLQAECVKWLWNEYPDTRGCFILVDNNATNVVALMQKKAMGLVTGAADTFFFWDKRIYFFEFKFGNNKQSPAQIQFQSVAKRHAEEYYLIYNKLQFTEAIKSILI